jgi:hypothetical protein
MVTVRQFVFGVALLIAAVGDSSGQSRSFRSAPPSPPATQQQPTISDQRGTDQSPLSVKVLPSPASKEDADREERARQEKLEADGKLADQIGKIASYTFWLGIFAFALLCAAVAQIGLFWFQLNFIRKGVDGAALAANAAQAATDATKRSIVLAEDTAQRQLRAYVMVHAAAIENLSSGRKPIARLILKNTGQTPAHAVSHWCSSGVAPYPMPDHVVRALRGRETEMSTKPLPPGAETKAWSESEILTEAQYEGLSEGTHALYVVGEIRYLDAFNKPQETDFLLFVGGPGGLIGELASYTTGNRAT